jgi:hypothetical protein
MRGARAGVALAATKISKDKQKQTQQRAKNYEAESYKEVANCSSQIQDSARDFQNSVISNNPVAAVE